MRSGVVLIQLDTPVRTMGMVVPVVVMVVVDAGTPVPAMPGSLRVWCVAVMLRCVMEAEDHAASGGVNSYLGNGAGEYRGPDSAG
ncbi:hypothetical protein GCM10028795_23780 [Lysobacter olei]